MIRNLILTGGVGHPFADASAALRDLLGGAGLKSEITDDIEGGLGALVDDDFDLVTVYALRWRMLSGEKYAPHRATWAFQLSQQGRRILKDFVERGGGLVALHTAVICFDDWPGWKDLIGGAWVWGQSFHPPYGPITVRPTAVDHPITAGLSDFELADEVYSNMDLAPDIVPLLSGSANGAASKGIWPMLWAREVGAGRVVCNTLGHDRASLEQATHRRILCNGARWAARRL